MFKKIAEMPSPSLVLVQFHDHRPFSFSRISPKKVPIPYLHFNKGKEAKKL